MKERGGLTLQQRAAPKSKINGNATSEIPEFTSRSGIIGTRNTLIRHDQRSGRLRQHDIQDLIDRLEPQAAAAD